VARQRGERTRAVELGQEALAVLERIGGADHPATLLARVHAGAALWAAGQAEGGERLLRAGTEGLERTFPTGHPDVTTARFLLGEALLRSGRTAETRPLLQAALDWRQAHLGPADPRAATVRLAFGASGR
jgi:hypothetical protein